MNTIAKRQKKLRRRANVAAMEDAALSLKAGESKAFKAVDVETVASIRMRLSRLKGEEGVSYETSIEGNNIVITRIA